MLVSDIPGEYSITDLACVLGVSRHVIERRVMTGLIRSVKMGHAVNSKRMILLADLKEDHPAIWHTILTRARVLQPFEPLDDE